MDNTSDHGHDENLAALICVKDNDGRIGILVGLLITVFFENPWTRTVRERVVAVAERYIEECRSHLKWAMVPNGGRFHPIDSGIVPFPRDWLPQHEEGEAWGFAFHGGSTKYEASPFHISAYGSNDVSKEDLGYFHVSFPVDHFADRLDTLPAYLKRVCECLKPVSGYGGLGLLESPHLSTADRFSPAVRTLAERFPGLEIESRLVHVIHLNRGIKGVAWLTALSDRWISQLGGLDYLRIRLGDEFYFYPYEGGVIIQAGPKPQVGDAQNDRWPALYVTLARVLKPIQVKEHYPFHLGGVGKLDYEATMAWINRFDGK
jgi:hypothetical protein